MLKGSKHFSISSLSLLHSCSEPVRHICTDTAAQFDNRRISGRKNGSEPDNFFLHIAGSLASDFLKRATPAYLSFLTSSTVTTWPLWKDTSQVAACPPGLRRFLKKLSVALKKQYLEVIKCNRIYNSYVTRSDFITARLWVARTCVILQKSRNKYLT